jgi:bifunctional UDP-N-acetylglucosamine pyrophosphorylase/glucosamine-1-phosphate N-acetyltransferase
MNNIQIIILAAGKGSRMKSKKPKVLQNLAGISLLQRIINTSLEITKDISIIYGFGGDMVKNAIKAEVNWIFQKEQNGTGSAIQVALPYIKPEKKVLILYGDVALISTQTLHGIIAGDTFSLLTVNLDNPTGYGRIVRENGAITSIVEQKDAMPEEAKIQEVNTGIMCVSGELLHTFIPQLSNNNAQQEYYLTDIIKLCVQAGIEITSVHPENELEITGVNDKLQLEQLERKYQVFQAENFMRDGLTIIDKNRFDNRGNLQFGKDCEVDINTIFSGDNTLGENVTIGANCHIINSTIADNTTILANCIIENAHISHSCTIGPFARIRPETVLDEHVKIGNFVEVKKSTISKHSKVNHLSYVGDSTIGANVNIGAGVITCNYDGANKHQTTIGDNAFIGSNSALVAPLTIGKNATIGAGSTITKTCENDKLSLSRAKQLTMHWQRPIKNSK